MCVCVLCRAYVCVRVHAFTKSKQQQLCNMHEEDDNSGEHRIKRWRASHPPPPQSPHTCPPCDAPRPPPALSLTKRAAKQVLVNHTQYTHSIKPCVWGVQNILSNASVTRDVHTTLFRQGIYTYSCCILFFNLFLLLNLLGSLKVF